MGATSMAQLCGLSIYVARYTKEVEMTDRAYALEVADWIERELTKAKATGETGLLRRPYIQNIGLIIKALREYGGKPNPKEGSKD